MDDSEGLRNSMKKVPEDVVEIARELELEVTFKDMSELLQSHDKNLTDKQLFLMDEQRKCFCEMEFCEMVKML